jgi:hypothetical protein
MITDQYLTNDIEPLSLKNTVFEAVKQMNELHLDLLPIIHNNHLVNYADINILEKMKADEKLTELDLYASVLPFVNTTQHLMNALTHLKSLNVSLMAVLDEKGEYQGILKTKDVVKVMSNSLSIRNSGSIIVLRIKPIDYSLSDLSRVIEYSDAKILGVFIYEVEGSGDLEIHLKLNTGILKHVLATLERYDYRVTEYFNREDLGDDIDQRFENLMNYIDN